MRKGIGGIGEGASAAGLPPSGRDEGGAGQRGESSIPRPHAVPEHDRRHAPHDHRVASLLPCDIAFTMSGRRGLPSPNRAKLPPPPTLPATTQASSG